LLHAANVRFGGQKSSLLRVNALPLCLFARKAGIRPLVSSFKLRALSNKSAQCRATLIAATTLYLKSDAAL
jgi:hypothetical protein